MAAFFADHDIFAAAAASGKKTAEKILIAASLPTVRKPTRPEASEKRMARRTETNVSPKQSSSKAWWTLLNKASKNEALQAFRAYGESKGLTMTAKTFASRVYKQPEFTDVQTRRAAHKDAREYIESIAKKAKTT